MTCSRPRCEREARSLGMCGAHYVKALRSGLLGAGKHSRVDSTEVVEHIRKLRALDWTWPMISEESGVAISVVHGLHTRPNRPASKATASAILAVPLRQAYPHSKIVDPAGTRRRVEALEYLGWPRMVIEQRIGVAYLSLSQALSRGKVTARMARLVEEFYLGSNSTLGPSELVAKRARNRGCLPASAWEDDVIDDPAAQPNLTGYDEETVRALIAGEQPRHRTADRAEATRRLGSLSIAELAQLFGVSRAAVGHVRRQLEAA